jgi:hypothetical protein
MIGITIKSLEDNTGVIAVGDESVTMQTGWILHPGDSFKTAIGFTYVVSNLPYQKIKIEVEKRDVIAESQI